MNIQLVIVMLFFVAALAYVARMILNTLKPSKGCGSNCKCGVDFSKIEAKDTR